ncbi:MAG: hypothetical protein IJG13_08875 [Kiritimatiellae bacterium]|nr:hypothetical protein [Kiritimatiellia bacterium]
MKLKDILAKVVKGDALTDEEKKFIGDYDEQKVLDAAASAARKKAETERDALKGEVEKLTKDLEDAKTQGAAGNDTIAKLQKDVAALMKSNKESQDKLAAQARTEAIRKAMGEAKVVCAKGISQALFDNAVSAAFNGVDMENADVVKATIDTFKRDNPAMISVDGIGGPGQKGQPGELGKWTGDNPFSKKTFNLTKGIELMKSNPEQAKAWQAEAATEAAQP